MARKLISKFSFVRGNILVLLVCFTIWSFSMNVATPFFSLYVLEFRGTPETIGFINALGALAGLILYPIGGYIADHRGRVKLVGIMTYFFALSNLFYIFAKDWTLLAAGWFFQRLFEMYVPAIYAIMADSLPPKQRGIGFATTVAIPGVVGMLSPYIGGYLIDLFQIELAMRFLYTFTLMCGLVVATLRYKFLKETIREAESTVPLRNIPLLLKTSYKSLWEALKWMPTSLRSLAAISIISAFFNSIAGAFWIVYSVQIIDLSPYQWGLTMLVMSALRLVLVLPAGMLVDKYGSRKIIVAAAFASIFPVFLFPYSKTFLHVVAVLLIISIANTFLMPSCQTLIANITPREKRGRIMAAFGAGGSALVTSVGMVMGFGVVVSIPRMIGSFASGIIYGADPVYPWYLLTLGLILSLILSLLLIREPKRLEL